MPRLAGFSLITLITSQRDGFNPRFHPQGGFTGRSAVETVNMTLAALAVLVPLVRAACPDPVDPDNPECAGCESQAAADATCRAFVESVHTEPQLFRCAQYSPKPSCLLATSQVL